MSDELRDLRAAVEAAEHARGLHRKRSELVDRLEVRVAGLRERVVRERRDVERLEGPGLVAFVRGLLVDRDRALDRERRELATATLLFDEARTELAEARAGLPELAAASRASPAARARFEALLRERSAEPGGLAPEDARELECIDLRRERRELREVERAANDVTSALDDLLAALGSARGLSEFDVWAGGTIVSMLKHGQLGTARSRLATVQVRLRVLARELEDVDATKLDVPDLDDFTGFVDVFLDNVFTDLAVHARILTSVEKARAVRLQVRKARTKVLGRIDVVERALRAASSESD